MFLLLLSLVRAQGSCLAVGTNGVVFIHGTGTSSVAQHRSQVLHRVTRRHTNVNASTRSALPSLAGIKLGSDALGPDAHRASCSALHARQLMATQGKHQWTIFILFLLDSYSYYSYYHSYYSYSLLVGCRC